MKTIFQKMILICTVIAAALMLSGCISAYGVHRHTGFSGEELPLEEASVLFVGVPMVPSVIDGEKVDLSVMARGRRVGDVVELTPGKHKIGFQYILYKNGRQTTSGVLSRNITTKPGMIYYTNFSLKDSKVKVWVTERGPVKLTSSDGKDRIELKKSPDTKSSNAEYFYEISREDGTSEIYPVYEYPDLNPLYSPDLKRIGLTKLEDKKFHIYADGFEGTYDAILSYGGQYSMKNMLKFSDDSSRLAFIARMGKEKFMVINGEEQKHYSNVTLIYFSPDSKRSIYAADDKIIVLDGKEAGEYEEVILLTEPFSPDSKRYKYGVKKDGKTAVVIDGEVQPYYTNYWIHNFWSPDSAHTVYIALDKDKKVIILDGEIIDTAEDMDQSSVAFSKDGFMLTYSRLADGEWEKVEYPLGDS